MTAASTAQFVLKHCPDVNILGSNLSVLSRGSLRPVRLVGSGRVAMSFYVLFSFTNSHKLARPKEYLPHLEPERKEDHMLSCRTGSRQVLTTWVPQY